MKHVACYSFVVDTMDVCANVAVCFGNKHKKKGVFRTKFMVLTHGAAAKVNSALPLVGLGRVKQ